MKNIFFIDSKAGSSASQYTFAFENHLFSPNEVDVIVRFRWRSFWHNLMAWRKYRFHLRFVLTVKNGLLPAGSGCVYYFFNSAENVKLVKNRNYAHVFMGHGESNKLASLHPLYRIYDYLLVAGPYAGDRLRQYGLLNQATIAERLLDIGGAGVANVAFTNATIIGKGHINTSNYALLYMPTWEGGLQEENYSTLDETRLAEFLAETAASFCVDTIFIKPHPNTGRRIKKQKGHLATLIQDLNIRGIAVAIEKKDLALIPLFQRVLITIKMRDLIHKPALACAIVDVSAAESMAAKLGVPSIVLACDKNTLCAPPTYVELKGRSIVYLSNWSSMRDLATYVHRNSRASYQRTYIKYFRDDNNDGFRLALLQIQNSIE